VTLDATVIVPTHVHGPTLYHSVGTALAQTVSDIEVIIVGDGVDAVTRGVVADLQRSDPRIRYLDFPKGPRNGEIHRHVALEEARGRIVCYLSDDDLWFPNHLAVMDSMLQDDVGFAHALPLTVEPGGKVADWPVDLALPYYRRQVLAGRNRISLSCGGHTLEAYRRLPIGWSTTPMATGGTDTYMWQKLLASGCRAMSGTQPTVLVFPSPLRLGWSIERRVEELSQWRRQVEAPEWRTSFVETTLDQVVRRRASELSTSPSAWLFRLLARTRLLNSVRRLRKAARGVFARGAR
jgi:hypothetical protein